MKPSSAPANDFALTPRRRVFDVLWPLEKGHEKRVLVDESLHRVFAREALTAADRAFMTALTYGVLRQWFPAGHVIETLSGKPIAKQDPRIRLLLRMGLYQLRTMDGVPDYAAVDSTLQLAEALKLSKPQRGFLNGVLRRFIREGRVWPDDPALTVPAWWLPRLKASYSSEQVAQILAAGQRTPQLTLRVNTLKTGFEQFAAALTEQNIRFETLPEQPEIFQLAAGTGDPAQLPGYAAGWFVVQDAASARIVPLLNAQPGETVLEIGAAPGTKTAQLAGLMQNTGQILALDISEKRMRRLDENCRRLGLTNVTPIILPDAEAPWPMRPVDRIFIDAPCSGTGTLGKHPEILLVMRPEDIAPYAETQQRLLARAAEALKPGGTVLYSTCSILPEENEAVIAACCRSLPLGLEKEHVWLPTAQHDGFYAALLRRL